MCHRISIRNMSTVADGGDGCDSHTVIPSHGVNNNNSNEGNLTNEVKDNFALPHRRRLWSNDHSGSFIRPPGVNPFDYDCKMSLLQWVKVVILGVTLLPLRIILLVYFVLLAAFFSSLSVVGSSAAQRERPLHGWRALMKIPIRLSLRAVLFVMGFMWVKKTKGKIVDSKTAPILCVASHSSLADLFYISSLCLPFGVSRQENSSIPIIGSIITALQPIYVSRTDPDSRKKSIASIISRTKTERGEWPHMIIFPEGTTTNRKALVTFKSGAFIPGVPVQPVCLKYQFDYFDPAWVDGGWSALKSLALMLCQVVNYMEVEFLPPYIPSVVEQTDYKLYCKNVRETMAAALNIPLTAHSYEDVQLMAEARNSKLPVEAGAIEWGKIAANTDISMPKAKSLLRRFADMQNEERRADGKVDIRQFANALSVPISQPLREVFDSFDIDSSGLIDFREYIIGLCRFSRAALDDEITALAFSVFDSAGVGSISEQDLERCLCIAFAGGRVDATQVKRLFDKVDVNKDGRIDYNEFKTFIEIHPEYQFIIHAVQASNY